MRINVSYLTRNEDAVAAVAGKLSAARPDFEVYDAAATNTAGAYWIARLGEEIAASDVLLLFLFRRVGAW